MSEPITLEANRIVYGNREETYGHPLDDFERTAAMWSAILGAKVSAEQVGLCMCALKISRQCYAAKRDNLVDLAGYAETVHRVVEERARRANEQLPGGAGPSDSGNSADGRDQCRVVSMVSPAE